MVGADSVTNASKKTPNSIRVMTCYFFFSSRRRHTRWPRDWSSDVCSSDLPEFDGGVAAVSGNFEATLGLEHHFTGHAGLLTGSGDSAAAPDTGDAVEHRFARWMAAEANLREYHQKTRQNIQRLFGWMDAIQRALPVEREELWSEGEENFEARLDAIAAHS